MSDNLSRREFIKKTALSGGLVFSFSLPGCSPISNGGISRSGEIEQWTLPAWLRIDSDGAIIFIIERVEMGQGALTGLVTLLCEELEVLPENVQTQFAPASTEYRNRVYNLQMTGASSSIVSSWEMMRKVGAAARMMLEKAAASVYETSRSDVYTENGYVFNKLNPGRKIHYKDLISIAATYNVPTNIPLKDNSFKLIGKYNRRLDAIDKSTGRTQYGIDIELPDMVYAVFIRPSRWDAELESYDLAEAKKMPGVLNVFPIIGKEVNGIAIVAKSYWQARKAQQFVSVSWKASPSSDVSDQTIFAQYDKALSSEKGNIVADDGDVHSKNEKAIYSLDASYQAPFLGHATLEPQNCTAWSRGDCLEIWAPTQAPDMAQVAAVKVTSYSRSQVKIHTTFLGGGFGRRLMQDYVAEAAAISEHLERPVKLIWSREEDTKRDWYRPSSSHHLKATFDPEGNIYSWEHRMAGSGVYNYFVKDAAPAQMIHTPKALYGHVEQLGKMGEGILGPEDSSIYEGANHIPYYIPNFRVEYIRSEAKIPVGYWRSVGHSHNGFIVETFLDRIAHQIKMDPYKYRLSLIKNQRAINVLTTAAKLANWGSAIDGCEQGISIHQSFGTWVAQVADVAIEGEKIKVKRVVCVVDCGGVVNRDIVISQMEGGIIFALTAALYGKISIVNGEVQESNFHDYKMLRMTESPEIVVDVIESSEPPSGVGEPGVPPLAGAVANAVSKITGKYFNSLPLTL